MTFTAWIDESGADSRRDPGTYLLSAALCSAEDLPSTRDRLRGLLLPGQRKVHWRDESDIRRMLVELDAAGVAVATAESRGPDDDRRDVTVLQALRTQRAR